MPLTGEQLKALYGGISRPSTGVTQPTTKSRLSPEALKNIYGSFGAGPPERGGALTTRDGRQLRSSVLRAVNRLANFGEEAKTEQRSFLDRVISPLMVGQNVFMNVLEKAAKEGKDNEGVAKDFFDLVVGTPAEVLQGVRASNPLGKGKPEYRKEFADVLKQFNVDAPWYVDFAGDVILDPLTWVPGGVALQGVKTTAKAGTKGAGHIAMKTTAGKLAKENIDQILTKYHASKVALDTSQKVSKLRRGAPKGVDEIDIAPTLAEKAALNQIDDAVKLIDETSLNKGEQFIHHRVNAKLDHAGEILRSAAAERGVKWARAGLKRYGNNFSFVVKATTGPNTGKNVAPLLRNVRDVIEGELSRGPKGFSSKKLRKIFTRPEVITKIDQLVDEAVGEVFQSIGKTYDEGVEFSKRWSSGRATIGGKRSSPAGIVEKTPPAQVTRQVLKAAPDAPVAVGRGKRVVAGATRSTAGEVVVPSERVFTKLMVKDGVPKPGSIGDRITDKIVERMLDIDPLIRNIMDKITTHPGVRSSLAELDKVQRNRAGSRVDHILRSLDNEWRPVGSKVRRDIITSIRAGDHSLELIPEEVKTQFIDRLTKMFQPIASKLSSGHVDIDEVNDMLRRVPELSGWRIPDELGDDVSQWMDILASMPFEDVAHGLGHLEVAYIRAASRNQINQEYATNFGFHRKSVDGKAMLKNKSGRRLPKNPKYGGMHDAVFPNDIADEIEKIYTRIWNQSDELGNFYDNLLGKAKAGYTIYNPSHQSGNFIGDSFMAWMGGMNNPRHFWTAGRILRNKFADQIPENIFTRSPQELAALSAQEGKRAVFKVKRGRHAGRKVSQDEAYAYAIKEGAFQGLSTTEFQTRLLDPSVSLTRPFGGRVATKVRAISSRRESISRFGDFIYQFEKKVNAGMSLPDAAREAGAHVRKWHIDYGDLSPWERKYAKRLVLFYTFTRKAVPLMVEAALMNPGKAIVYPKLQNALIGNAGYDYETPIQANGEIIPRWMREVNVIPIPGLEGYFGQLPIPLNSELGKLGEGRTYLSALAPPMKWAIEVGTKQNLYTGAPIKDKSEYLESQIPILGRWERILGVRSAPTGGGLNPAALANLLTGLGIQQNTEARQKGELRRMQDIIQAQLQEARNASQ